MICCQQEDGIVSLSRRCGVASVVKAEIVDIRPAWFGESRLHANLGISPDLGDVPPDFFCRHTYFIEEFRLNARSSFRWLEVSSRHDFGRTEETRHPRKVLRNQLGKDLFAHL